MFCILAGLRNLVRLAASHSASRFYFCSSTAAVLGPDARQPVPERISSRPEDAVAMGYARSKHLAETLCDTASTRGGLRGRIGVLRLGQLCGDTKEGIWKGEEGWPLLISSAASTGCLPDLKEVRHSYCDSAVLTDHINGTDAQLAASRQGSRGGVCNSLQIINNRNSTGNSRLQSGFDLPRSRFSGGLASREPGRQTF